MNDKSRKGMGEVFASLALAFALCLGVASQAQGKEVIVFVRHGEKPPGGYGQLSCQGLNRALALPDVLIGKFGKPAAIFAPNPTGQVPDGAGKFYYVRPLATIEPTAIRLGVPLQTPYVVTDQSGLDTALTNPELQDSVVYVAWEHIWLTRIVKSLLAAHGGNAGAVPDWPDDDYDQIYIVTLTRDSSGKIMAGFNLDHEGLNNMSTACPR